MPRLLRNWQADRRRGKGGSKLADWTSKGKAEAKQTGGLGITMEAMHGWGNWHKYEHVSCCCIRGSKDNVIRKCRIMNSRDSG